MRIVFDQEKVFALLADYLYEYKDFVASNMTAEIVDGKLVVTCDVTEVNEVDEGLSEE